MTRWKSAACAAGLLAVFGAALFAKDGPQQKPAPAAPPVQHLMQTPDQLKWGPAPPSLPPGAQMTVVSGDPGAKGPFVIRAKFPDGYRVPPHWHPTEENVTVLSGTLLMGTGDKVDPAAAHALGAGSFSRVAANVHHYVTAKGETTIQVHGMGPFAVTYVNPKDDPRKGTGTATK